MQHSLQRNSAVPETPRECAADARCSFDAREEVCGTLVKRGASHMDHLQRALFLCKCKEISAFCYCHTWPSRTILEKKLPPMKLFPPFFVLTCEDNDKLDVAEMEHDDDNC
jgi:hypothetical protein